jgi:glycosyltransferase 2 family protein
VKKISPILRFLVSAGLIVYLVLTVDFRPLAEVFPAFRWTFYLAGLVLMAVYVLLQAFILDRLLKNRGIVTSWVRMVRYNLIGSFFGVFLPGGAGADIVMAFSLCRNASDKASVVSSILFARVAGLTAMVLLAFVVSITLGSPVPGVVMVTVGVLAIVAMLIIGNELGLFRSVQQFVITRHAQHRVIGFVDRSMNAMSGLTGSYRMLSVVAPAMLVMGLGRALMDYFMARSLGVVLPFHYFIIFSTVVSLVTVLPITIAGLGLREVTFTGLFAMAGVSQALAVSISLLSFSLSLWVCLAGGIAYAGGGWRQAS